MKHLDAFLQTKRGRLVLLLLGVILGVPVGQQDVPEVPACAECPLCPEATPDAPAADPATEEQVETDGATP